MGDNYNIKEGNIIENVIIYMNETAKLGETLSIDFTNEWFPFYKQTHQLNDLGFVL